MGAIKNSLALYELESVWVWKNWDLTPKRRINYFLGEGFHLFSHLPPWSEAFLEETSYFCSYLLPLSFDSILNVFSTALDLG